jgi:uncharacterized lipoprotein YajG
MHPTKTATTIAAFALFAGCSRPPQAPPAPPPAPVVTVKPKIGRAHV